MSKGRNALKKVGNHCSTIFHHYGLQKTLKKLLLSTKLTGMALNHSVASIITYLQTTN